MVKKSGHMVGHLLALVAFPVDFFFSSSSIYRKNDVAKILGLFDVCKILESQKHAKNKNIYFIVLKLNERGSFRKSMESMENMSMSL
jgi:hypothetical protein